MHEVGREVALAGSGGVGAALTNVASIQDGNDEA